MAAYADALNELNAATQTSSGGGSSGGGSVESLLRNKAAEYDIDPDLFVSLAKRESGLRPDARNPNPGSTAGGLFQFIDGTWNRYGNKRDKFDPEANADAAARMLRDHLGMFGGDYNKALAAHHVGAGKAERALTDGSIGDVDVSTQKWLSEIYKGAGRDGAPGNQAASENPNGLTPAPRSDYSRAFEHFSSVPGSTLDDQLKAGEAPKESGINYSKEIGAAIDSYQSNLWAIPAAMGSEYALKAMQENKAAAEKNWQESGAPQSFDEMEFGKNFGNYFAHMGLQSAPYMVEFMATGFGVGSAAKAALANTAKGVAEKAAIEAAKLGATKEVAKKAGEAAAAQYMGKVYTASGVAGSYPSAVGDILSNQHEQAGKFDLGAAAALGVPYAALNAAGTEGMLTRAVARGLPKTAIAKEGAAGFAGRAALTGAEAAAMEGSTETGQEVMNQLGRMAVDPNAKIDDPRALDAYKESFIAGALLGGVPGAAAGGFRKAEVQAAEDLHKMAGDHLKPSEPKPNSPLSNAAQAVADADPISEALKPISARLADREFYAQIRNHPNLGPDSLSQILASYRIATNSNIDPASRQAAVGRLSEFFRLFDNQPNFTMGESGVEGAEASAPAGLPVVAGEPATAVGPADPRVGSIDGQSSRLPPDSERIAQGSPALLTDDRVKETAAKRGDLLNRVLSSNPDNPNRSFDRALRLDGFRDSTFTDDEKAKIAQFIAMRSAQAGAQASTLLPVPSQGRYQHLADKLASGWKPASRGQLSGPNGEIYNLNGAGEVQFVRNKLNQVTPNDQQIPGSGNEGDSGEGGIPAGGRGNDGPLPNAGGDQVAGGTGENIGPESSGSAVQPDGALGNAGASNGDVGIQKPSVTVPENKRRWIYDANRNVVEAEAIHDVEYAELPGRKFFTRQQADGKFSVTDEYSGGGVFLGSPTEAEAIGGLQAFMHKAGVDKVRTTLEAQPKIEAPKVVSTKEPIKKDKPTTQYSVTRIYKTRSGKVGARIEKVIGPTGKVFYNYTGEWGAGSGHALAQMDKIESMWRKEKRGYTVVEADAVADQATVAKPATAEEKLHSKEAEVKNPATLDELVGAVDAGYRAHYDYAGADGSTVWIEKTEVSGRPVWVMKWVDDEYPGTTQTKGGAGLNTWDKYKALKAVEDKVKYRFTEWKPLAESAPSPVDTSMRDTGAKAFKDGLPRTAPERLKGADKVRWLTGYDDAAKSYGKSQPAASDVFEKMAARMEVEQIEGSDEYVVFERGERGNQNFARFTLGKGGNPVRIKHFFESASTRTPVDMAIKKWAASQQKTDTAAEPVVNHEIDALTVDVVQNPHHKSEKLININGDLVGVVSRARQQGTSDWGWRGTVSGELHFTEDKAIQVEIEAAKEKYKQRIRTVSLLKTDTAAEPAAQQATAITAENDIEKLANDFRTYPTQVLSAVINNGQAPMLYKAAGVRSADAFSGLPIAGQAEAYAKFVQDGGTKALEFLPSVDGEQNKPASVSGKAGIDSWRSEFESAKKDGDKAKIQALYDKVRIVLNGIAQSHGDKAVSDFNALKKEIEQYAKNQQESAADEQEAGGDAEKLGDTKSYSEVEKKLINGEINVEDFMSATGLTDDDVGFLTGNDLRQQADVAAKENSPYFSGIRKLSAAIFKEIEGLSRGSTAQSRRAYDANLAKYKAAQDTLEVIAKNFEHPFRNTLLSKLPPFLESRYSKQWDSVEYGDKAKKSYRSDSYSRWVDLLIDAARKKSDAKQINNPDDSKPDQAQDFSKYILISADDISKLRKIDVDRVLEQGAVKEFRQEFADWIKAKRPDLAGEVDEVMAGMAPAAPAEPEAPTTPTSEMDDLKAQMAQAVDELAAILGVKTNLTPEEESQLIPVMAKMFRIAAKMSFVKFKDAARWVLDTIRAQSPETADKLSIDNLQAGYINIAKEIGGNKREALDIESLDDLYSVDADLQGRINGAKEKAAAERLAQLLDKIDQVRINRNTPEGSAKGIVRSVIEELRKERTAVSVVELLETASQRLLRQHAPFSEVIDQVVESLRSDASPDNKGDIKQAPVSLDKFGLTVRRSQTKNGTPTWEVSGNTRDHVATLRNAGGKWYGPKKVWSFYSEESPESKILAALGAMPQPAEVSLSEIEVERKSEGTGRIKTYKQRADEALSEIDERMGLGKQLLECLNS